MKCAVETSGNDMTGTRKRTDAWPFDGHLEIAQVTECFVQGMLNGHHAVELGIADAIQMNGALITGDAQET